MVNNKPVVAVFGLHTWGEHILRILKGLDIPTHGVDPDPGIQHSITKHYPDITVHRDANSVFLDHSITSCIITAPSSLHYHIAKQSLLAGKHVLVEKPMTQNIREAEELVWLAKKQHRRLMVDHTYLFSPALIQAKRIISSGRIGRIRYIRSERSGPGPLRPDSSVLWDLAPHDISVAWLLTGRYPTHARLLKSFPNTSSGPYDANIELSFYQELTFHGHISWIMPQKIRTLTVIGTNAALTVEWDGIQEILRYHPVSDQHVSRFSYRTPTAIRIKRDKEPLAQSVEYFLSSVRKRPTTLTDGTHGLAVIRTIMTLHRQGIIASKTNDAG